MIDVCLSGGATGADTIWGICAGSVGHSVIHYSFSGHKTECPTDRLIVLNKEELKNADKYLKHANKTLKRKIPFDGYKRNLLRRNMYQVELTKSVYVISKLKDGFIDGGSAWAAQMYLDRQIEFSGKSNLYLFDQEKKKWFQWHFDKGFIEINSPPKPTGLYTGIGTRFINEDGINAIKSLFQ